ncbi:MAG: TonB-dependent receptor [Spirochaetes bacterium]|nr:TonB-dependent receptor [Spirochaetota bacterium]
MLKKAAILFLFFTASMSLLAQDVNGGDDIIQPAFAADDETADDNSDSGEDGKTVIVTAARRKTSVESATVPVTVLASDDIEAAGGGRMTDIVNRSSSMYISRTGGKAGTSSVFIGGAPSESVVYMIDGFKINDITLPSGGFNLSLLNCANVKQVEIVQGAYSTLYGSDALGGVMNIIPKNGTENEGLEIISEYGSYNSFFESVGFNGSDDSTYGSINVTYNYIDGLSKADEPSGYKGDFEKDTDRMINVSGKAGILLSDKMFVEGVLYYSDMNSEIDKKAATDEKDHLFYDNLLMGGLRFKHQLADFYTYEIKGSVTQSERIDDGFSTSFFTESNGYRGNYELINYFNLWDIDEIIIGSENEVLHFNSINNYNTKNNVSTNSYSYYGQNLLKLNNIFTVQTGIRYYKSEEYAGAYTYQTGVNIILPVIKTAIKSSYSTGYTVPTLYQLFDTYGNRELKPEKSISFSAGINQPLGNVFSFGIDYIETEFKDKVLYDTAVWKYVNNDLKTKDITANIKIAASKYDYIVINGSILETKDELTENDLLRRPEYKASIVGNTKILNMLYVNMVYIYTGERDDFSLEPNDKKLDAYHKIDAKIEYKFNDYFNAYLRAENLLNEDYQEAYGYTAPGLSVFGGLKITI